MTTDATGRQRSRDPDRSAEILRLFTRNVARRGYAESNFSEIANELNISKGTIVHHFGTKDRLFARMHDSYMERRLAEAERTVSHFRRPDEQLTALLFSFLLYQEIDRDCTVAFQREIATLASHESLARGRSLRSTYLGLVRSVLQRGVAERVFRQLDVEAQSLLIFGSSQWAWTWYEPGGRMSALQIGGQFVQMALGGLLIDQSHLDELADPTGTVATAVWNLLATGGLQGDHAAKPHAAETELGC